MKKRLLASLLIACLAVTGSMWSVAFADDLDDQMAEVEREKEQVSTEMAEMKDDIEAAREDVAEIQSDIDKKQDEISETAGEIESLKSEMSAREEGLNDRLRAMYKNGSIGYLEVLLGSSSISEFLNNVEMIQRIYRNDQDTLETLEEQHGVLEGKQAELEHEKAELDAQKEVEAAKQAELEESQAALQAKLDALNAEADAITAEIQARQKELAAQREESKNNGGGDGNSQEQTYEDYNGGAMAWPCDSRIITSEFGFRIHPLTGIYTGHTGIDIGCNMYAPIYAAESGTVILAEWYGGYGNAVVIDHGGGVTTLYGHNEELYVSVGQQVRRGETIAGAGSTGWSTGPHCHFEVRVNGDYVDPMGYL
ncbi:MAG: peptidoglycan DD-metalloendopeptidase family protein [Firmicutes bacterium]|nr:peptidoglycan DD-metalloendopeptidase family protein [Bacillota bacterium]